MKNIFSIIAVLCSVVLLSVPTFAQDDEEKVSFKDDDTLNIDDMYMDFAVPELSAFSMLDVQGDEIVRAGSIKKFAVSMASAFDNGQEIKPGFAVEFAPSYFAKTRKKEWWNRSFRPDNFAFTIATASQDSMGLLGAIGIKWVPIDNTIPHGEKDKDFFQNVYFQTIELSTKRSEKFESDYKKFKAYMMKICNNDPVTSTAIQNASFDLEENDDNTDHENIKNDKIDDPTQYLANKMYEALANEGISITGQDTSTIRKYAQKFVNHIQDDAYKKKTQLKVEELKAEYKKDNWYKGSLLFSAGMVTALPDNKWKEARFNKFSAIVSGATPLGIKFFKKHYSQVLGQVKMDWATSDTVEFTTKYSIGTRLIIGNADNRVSIEGLYNSTQLKPEFQRNNSDQLRFLRTSVGLELKILNDTWLELALGNQWYFEGENGSELVPNFGFKHAFQNRKRRFQ